MRRFWHAGHLFAAGQAKELYCNLMMPQTMLKIGHGQHSCDLQVF